MDPITFAKSLEFLKFILLLGVPWLLKIAGDIRTQLRELNHEVISLKTWRGEAALRFSEIREDIHDLQLGKTGHSRR